MTEVTSEVPSTPQSVPTEDAPEGNPPIYSTPPLRETHLHEKLSALPHLTTSPHLSSLAAYPAHIICPACNESITTHLKHRIGEKAQYIPLPTFPWPITAVTGRLNMINGRSRMAIGCLIAGVFGAMVPLCMKSVKDVEHFCPNCISLRDVVDSRWVYDC
jgi:hypothetical protein